MATYRVLCLHGYGQDAAKFRGRISALRRCLKSSFDFVFPEAPFVVDSWPGASEEEQAKRRESGEVTYKWWDFEINDATTNTHTYGRVDEAVDYLADFVRKEGPFDGIFGFSQGGMMASLILQRQMASPTESPFGFKFGIFIESADQGDARFASEQKVDLPTLHIMGETDAIVTIDRSRALLDKYVGPKVFVHPGGHFIPTNKEAKDAFREFVQQLKTAHGKQ